MEAVISGIPGIAFSLAGDEEGKDFTAAASMALHIVGKALQEGLAPDTLLNVNVPNRPQAELRGVRITRQGQRLYRDALDARQDPRGRNYYWIGGDVPTGVPDEGTDFGAIAQGYVSITPLQLDLTAYRQAQEMAAWSWAADEGERDE